MEQKEMHHRYGKPFDEFREKFKTETVKGIETSLI